jgi:hypothetical protein
MEEATKLNKVSGENVATNVIRVGRVFAARIFYFAGAVLFLAFYGAAADTTVFTLSQITHNVGFWSIAFILAGVYTIVEMVISRNK